MSPLLHVLTLATCLARLGCGATQSLQPADTSLFSLDGVLQPGQLEGGPGEQEGVPDKQEGVPEEQEEVANEQEEVPDKKEEVHEEQEEVLEEQEGEQDEVPDEQDEEESPVRVTESGAVVRSQVTEQGRVVNIDQADLTLDYDLGDTEQDSGQDSGQEGLVLKTGEVVYPCDVAGVSCQVDGTPGVCRGPEPWTCIAISNTTTVPTVSSTSSSSSSSSTTTANTNVTTTTPASAVSDATPAGDNAASRSDEVGLDTSLIIAIAAAASVILALAVTAAVCYKRSKTSKASYNVAETENIRRPKQAHV